jgi:hypothetical protein
MKSELAEELLDKLMGWDREAFGEKVRLLEALATYKFDEYGNFLPGVKFFESLAAWLDQFDDLADRATALDFVLSRLIFISDAEMTHLIELIYPDHIEMVLRARAATESGISQFSVAQLVRSDAFLALRRRSLILGASDGAQLGRLRRSASTLSHEQYVPNGEPSVEIVTRMRDQLIEALAKHELEAPPNFSQIFLVDDFAGSGGTLLRRKDGELKGKLVKLQDAIADLHAADLVSDDVDVTVILYVATEQALRHLEEVIAESELPDWKVRAAQLLPSWIRVDKADHALAELAERYYDEVLTDDIKGRVPLGYSDCALPVVLSHNTPNNSVSLLWADTTDEPDGLGRRALFPRYERHHRDRP